MEIIFYFLIAAVVVAGCVMFYPIVFGFLCGGIVGSFSLVVFYSILLAVGIDDEDLNSGISVSLAIIVGIYISLKYSTQLWKAREEKRQNQTLKTDRTDQSENAWKNKEEKRQNQKVKETNHYNIKQKKYDKTTKKSIILIGQEAVGKTTLLSLMYKEFSKNNKFQQFVASDDSGIALEKAYQKLCSIIDQPNFTKPPRLLPGTAGIVEYHFNIENNDFAVYDTAGGLLMRADGDDFDDFKSVISNASAIINVIDGAAMIEGSDFLSDRVNSPTRVRDILSRHKGNNPCLIIFVITKCERWLKSPNELERLKDAFENRHKAILNWVEQNPNCVGIFVPVKTLGCVEFSKKMGRGEDETLVFYKKTNLKFSQEHVDKPILYAVQYCMNRSLLPVEKHFHLYGGASSTA